MSRARQARLLLVAGLAVAVAGLAWGAAAWQRWHAAEAQWLEQVQRLEQGEEGYDARTSDARWQVAQRWREQVDRALVVLAAGIAVALLGRGTLWGTRQPRRAPVLPPPAARLLLATWLDAGLAVLIGWLLARHPTGNALAIGVVALGLVSSLLAAGGTPGMVLAGLRALDAGGRPPAPARAAMAALLLPAGAVWVAATTVIEGPLAAAGRLRSALWSAPHLAAAGIVAARPGGG